MSTLPEWLRPRDRERTGPSDLRLVETTLLLLVALLLAIATVNDVVRQTHINHRLIADLRTWRQYTGHDYHTLNVEQERIETSHHRDVICGNVSPGSPKSRTQLCLAMGGPQRAGRRSVLGGWYLPPHSEDLPTLRYGCFGEGARGACPR